jgi:DNA-binding transcriptional LysR family regulator
VPSGLLIKKNRVVRRPRRVCAVARFVSPAPGLSDPLSVSKSARIHAGRSPQVAEVDDVAMLRLLVRNSDSVAFVPSVVVQDELRSGGLWEYCVVPNLHENFYAISIQQSAAVRAGPC